MAFILFYRQAIERLHKFSHTIDSFFTEMDIFGVGVEIGQLEYVITEFVEKFKRKKEVLSRRTY